MDIKRLNKYYSLKQEIADLEKRIEEIKNTGGISGVKYREVDVMRTRKNNSIQNMLTDLLDKLNERRISAIEEYLKIESYIQRIEEPEIRQIMRYRYIDMYKWDKIDALMHYASGYSKVKYHRYKMITFDNE